MQRLYDPVKHPISHEAAQIGSEIRYKLLGMPTSERLNRLRLAIESGEELFLRAVAVGPPDLLDLPTDMHSMARDRGRKRINIGEKAMATVLQANYGEPELTLDLGAEVLAAFPFFLGGDAGFFASQCEAGHAEPRHVDLVLKAGLIAGMGLSSKEAEGVVYRLRHQSESPVNAYAATAIRDALLVV